MKALYIEDRILDYLKDKTGGVSPSKILEDFEEDNENNVKRAIRFLLQNGDIKFNRDMKCELYS